MQWLRYLRFELTVAALLITVGVIVWASSQATASGVADGYHLLDADLEPFRSAFNAAQDHVRAVLLVGPT